MRILVVRRDNIGDLVCTTPLLSALRSRFPDARIEALVNTYNGDALKGNSDVDAIHTYEKAKHRGGRTLLRTYMDRIGLIRRLRRLRFDYVILAGPGIQRRSLNIVRWIGARSVVGFVERSGVRGISVPVEAAGGADLHEVEDTFRLLTPLGIAGSPPALRVFVEASSVAAARLAWTGRRSDRLRVAIHLSARKPSQRWPAENFIALVRKLAATGVDSMLLWSPGIRSDARHPGDDAKAQAVAHGAGEGLCVRLPTRELPALAGALATCDLFVGADGGAMHLAAGLGKPAVCLFGDSNPARWCPWQVPHRVLQARSRDVIDISIDEVFEAVRDIAAAIQPAGR